MSAKEVLIILNRPKKAYSEVVYENVDYKDIKRIMNSFRNTPNERYIKVFVFD